MKKLIVLIGLCISIGVFARPYEDSICISDITGTDTVLYLALNKVSFGGAVGLEIEFNDLSDNSAQIYVGMSMWGNTFNYNERVFPIYLDRTDSTTVNGTATGITIRSDYISTKIFIIENSLLFNYLAIRIVKNTATTGCVYYIIRQK